jgi:hypothetical protein
MGGIPSRAFMLLFRSFGSGGSGAKLYSFLPPGDIFHGEVRGGEYHGGRIGGLAMEVRVSALLRDLLGFPGFTAAICKWGRHHM